MLGTFVAPVTLQVSRNRDGRGPARLVSFDSRELFQKVTKGVQSVQHAVTGAGIHTEGLCASVGESHCLRRQVYRDRRLRIPGDLLKEVLVPLPGKLHRQQSVPVGVVPEDVGESPPQDDPEPPSLKGPGSVLPGASAPEVFSHQEDRGAIVAWVMRTKAGSWDPSSLNLQPWNNP